MTIPIASDYDCDFASNGGCWFRVRVTFNGVDPSGRPLKVFDATTWTAGVISDPVRLVE
jgi:hypothetical protein